MWLQHYLKVGHAKRHHMGLLLDRSGDAAFGNHQTLRRAKKGSPKAASFLSFPDIAAAPLKEL